ncbi:multicopper oxidase family protein, partial [Nostocoides japonicum]|uniref:multicopper oxidase family protein n=1 Tax=Nostocoides japonicum TaxID=99481 RepID=UPI0012F85E80
TRVVSAALRAAPTALDLGGPAVRSWAFDDSLPGPLLRMTAGETLRVELTNDLPVPTSIHWHGLALRNDMDGVPGLTQAAVQPGDSFRYDFTAPDPGTYFYHPHVGVQLDRGLYGVLVVEDPQDPGGYDTEWVVVLDDWLDGTGTTPDDALAALVSAGGSGNARGGMDGMPMDGMGGMPMGGMPMGGVGGSPLLGTGGDVEHPHYLVNGRVPSAPATLTARPGQRVRIRLVNAAADTAFRVAVGGHRVTVTHSDGFPVQPVVGDALLVGMGERYDLLVTVGDGAFPLVARPEGKPGLAMAVVRTASGPTPTGSAAVELGGRVLTVADLAPVDTVRLTRRAVDRTLPFVLGGSMSPYRWTVNGKAHPDADPLPVRQGERARLEVTNASMMFHPVHLHGHTFAVVGTGVRKDTVIVRPMQRVLLDVEADNPGQWAAHCHNAYHAEAGMMTTFSYVT